MVEVTHVRRPTGWGKGSLRPVRGTLIVSSMQEVVSSLVKTTREGYRPFSFSFLGSLSGAGDEVREPTDVPKTLGAVGDMLSMPGTEGGEELMDARRNASTPFL